MHPSKTTARVSPRTPKRRSGRTTALALLFILLFGTPKTLPATDANQPAPPKPLQGDDKLLLVLNRFTYGPRAGDLEHLRQIGLQAWFTQQLNPRSIDDSALDVRLADYPAMQLSIGELMRRYPNEPMVRRIMNGVAAVPSGEAEQAIYANEIARYQQKLEGKPQPPVQIQPQPAMPSLAAVTIGGQTASTNPAEAAITPDAETAATPNAETRATPDTVTRSTPGSVTRATPDLVTRPEPQTPPTPLPFTPAEALAMPPDQRFEALCHLRPKQQKALREALLPADRPRLAQGFTSLQLEQFAALERPAPVVAAEAIQTKLLRDIYSERQLNEIMTDFWLNHFNVYLRKNQFAPYYIAAYARDTIRPRALGSFENLLIATAVSPAMLSYLDNASSVGPDSPFAHRPGSRFNQTKKPDIGLNENYARELMELHTLGVDGGYTQHDVTEVAKVFTGWTLGDPSQPRGPGGQFRGPGLPIHSEFDESKHQPGTKLVLGHTISSGGEREGLEVLHLLATSPSTARFISTKLAVRFVSDDPPPAMVARMTQTFLATSGNIREVLLAMVNSPEFFTTTTAHAKVKTPVDFVVSAVRASNTQIESAGALADVVAKLGMPIYGMQTPNGYSMKADPWNNTASLVARLNFALALSTNRVIGVQTNWDGLLASNTSDTKGPATQPQPPNQTASQSQQASAPAPSSIASQNASIPDEALDQSVADLLNDTDDSPEPAPASTPPQAAQQPPRSTAKTATPAVSSVPPATLAAIAQSAPGIDQIVHLPAAAKERLLESALLHEPASQRTRQAILAQITADNAQQQASLKQVIVENRSRDPLAIYRAPQPPPPTEGQNSHNSTSEVTSPSRRPPPFDLQAALAAGLLFGSPEFQRR